jgi:hypothetical protein
VNRPEETDSEFTWQPYRVMPQAVWAMRMNTDFKCMSLRGMLEGKAGDWLVRHDGFEYPLRDQIFRRYYVKREWRKHESQSPESSTEKNEQEASQSGQNRAAEVG